MIKGYITTNDYTTFKNLLFEIISHSDFEIISHSATSIKYYFVSATGSKTLSALTYQA